MATVSHHHHAMRPYPLCHHHPQQDGGSLASASNRSATGLGTAVPTVPYFYPTTNQATAAADKSKKTWSQRLKLNSSGGKNDKSKSEKQPPSSAGASSLSSPAPSHSMSSTSPTSATSSPAARGYADPWVYGTVRGVPAVPAHPHMFYGHNHRIPAEVAVVVCSCPEYLNGTKKEVKKASICKKCRGSRLPLAPIGGTVRLAPNSAAAAAYLQHHHHQNPHPALHPAFNTGGGGRLINPNATMRLPHQHSQHHHQQLSVAVRGNSKARPSILGNDPYDLMRRSRLTAPLNSVLEGTGGGQQAATGMSLKMGRNRAKSSSPTRNRLSAPPVLKQVHINKVPVPQPQRRSMIEESSVAWSERVTFRSRSVGRLNITNSGRTGTSNQLEDLWIDSHDAAADTDSSTSGSRSILHYYDLNPYDLVSGNNYKTATGSVGRRRRSGRSGPEEEEEDGLVDDYEDHHYELAIDVQPKQVTKTSMDDGGGIGEAEANEDDLDKHSRKYENILNPLFYERATGNNSISNGQQPKKNAVGKKNINSVGGDCVKQAKTSSNSTSPSKQVSSATTMIAGQRVCTGAQSSGNALRYSGSGGGHYESATLNGPRQQQPPAQTQLSGQTVQEGRPPQNSNHKRAPRRPDLMECPSLLSSPTQGDGQESEDSSRPQMANTPSSSDSGNTSPLRPPRKLSAALSTEESSGSSYVQLRTKCVTPLNSSDAKSNPIVKSILKKYENVTFPADHSDTSEDKGSPRGPRQRNSTGSAIGNSNANRRCGREDSHRNTNENSINSKSISSNSHSRDGASDGSQLDEGLSKFGGIKGAGPEGGSTFYVPSVPRKKVQFCDENETFSDDGTRADGVEEESAWEAVGKENVPGQMDDVNVAGVVGGGVDDKAGINNCRLVLGSIAADVLAGGSNKIGQNCDINTKKVLNHKSSEESDGSAASSSSSSVVVVAGSGGGNYNNVTATGWDLLAGERSDCLTSATAGRRVWDVEQQRSSTEKSDCSDSDVEAAVVLLGSPFNPTSSSALPSEMPIQENADIAPQQRSTNRSIRRSLSDRKQQLRTREEQRNLFLDTMALRNKRRRNTDTRDLDFHSSHHFNSMERPKEPPPPPPPAMAQSTTTSLPRIDISPRTPERPPRLRKTSLVSISDVASSSSISHCSSSELSTPPSQSDDNSYELFNFHSEQQQQRKPLQRHSFPAGTNFGVTCARVPGQRIVMPVAPTVRKDSPAIHRLEIKSEGSDDVHYDAAPKKTSIMISGDDCYSTVNVNDETALYQSSVVVNDRGVGGVGVGGGGGLATSSINNTVTINVGSVHSVTNSPANNVHQSPSSSKSVIPIGDTMAQGREATVSSNSAAISHAGSQSASAGKTLISVDYKGHGGGSSDNEWSGGNCKSGSSTSRLWAGKDTLHPDVAKGDSTISSSNCGGAEVAFRNRSSKSSPSPPPLPPLNATMTLPAGSKQKHEDELNKLLRNPVEAVRLNLVPHVCGKGDDNELPANNSNGISSAAMAPAVSTINGGGSLTTAATTPIAGSPKADIAVVMRRKQAATGQPPASDFESLSRKMQRNSFIAKLLEDPTLGHLAEGLDNEIIAKLIESSLVRLKDSLAGHEESPFRTSVATSDDDTLNMTKLIDLSLEKLQEERRQHLGLLTKQQQQQQPEEIEKDRQSNVGSVSSGNSYSSTNYEMFDFDNNPDSDCYQSCSSELTTEDDSNSARSKFYQMLVDATLSEIEISTNLDEDHHYESIRLGNDPIYEEISEIPPPLPLSLPPLGDNSDLEKKHSRRMFEGASKYDILSYLVDAKERGVVPEESYTYNFSNTSDVIVEEETGDEDGDLSLRSHKRQSSDVGSRISDASDDTIVSTETKEKLMTQRKSSSDIERNDSGVGSETSKSSRNKFLGGSVLDKNSPIHLCEDCDGPVETQITDAGVMYAPLVCRKCGKKRAERKEIITEIVETEEKYGRDLQIILEEFYQPMLVAGLLTQEQLSAIFLNTEELLENNQTLAERMRDALDIASEQGDDDLLTVNIGKVFMDATPMLHAFETYCVGQAAASLLLANLEKEKELLRIFLRVSQMENSVLRRMNLNSFLMVPVQRVTKYPLLLARLYKVTPPQLEGRLALKQAQEKIELHLNHMNQEAKDIPTKLWRRISSSSPGRRSSCEIDMINIKLRKMAIDILEWNHDEVRFAMEGKLLFTQPTDNNWRKGRTIKLAPINALLVTHGKPSLNYRADRALNEPLNFPRHTGIREASLLLVREKSGRYTLLRDPLYLDRCVICSEADWADYFEVQEISSKDTFIFKAEDENRTKQWYAQLQYHSQGMGAWRKRRNALANIMINGMMMRS